MKMLKIAYCAGHCMNTPGKRLPKALDPNETREWVLNDRVARAFAAEALTYEGVQLMRTDDPTGKVDISIKERTAKANAWGADIYLDFHHNAAGRVFTGGGVEAFCFPGSKEGAKLRNAIYTAVITAGGLKGNRSKPLQEKRFDTLKYAAMPAALIEYGFMDSRTDAPVILMEEYSKKVGIATMMAVAQLYGLKKLPADPEPEDKPTKKLEEDGKWGKATTTRLQQIFGTTVDGEVSNQYKKYAANNPGLTSGWEWQDKPNGKGSSLIRAMQKWAGMPEGKRDGEWGPETCKAVQRKLGTTADGRVSNPSQMVRALQRWANKQ